MKFLNEQDTIEVHDEPGPSTSPWKVTRHNTPFPDMPWEGHFEETLKESFSSKEEAVSAAKNLKEFLEKEYNEAGVGYHKPKIVVRNHDGKFDQID